MQIEPHIRFKEYALGQLLLAFPVSLLLSVYLKVIQFTLRKPLPRIPIEDLPTDMLLYAFHRDFYFLHGSGGVQRIEDPKVVWLGYHGFASYFPLLLARWNRLHLFRFRFTKNPRPFEQIVSYLESHPQTPFGILTDAGGPYNRVRTSVFELAKRTGRPVVALKLRASRFFSVGNHFIPLPFARVEASLSPPMTIEGLEREPATAHFQQVIEELP